MWHMNNIQYSIYTYIPVHNRPGIRPPIRSEPGFRNANIQNQTETQGRDNLGKAASGLWAVLLAPISVDL